MKGAGQTEQREGTRAARQHHRVWLRCTSSRGWKNGNSGVYDQHLGTVNGIFPLQVYGRALQAIGGLRMDRIQGPAIGCGWFCSTEHQADEGRRAGGTEGRNTRCPPTPRMALLHRQPGLEERKRRRIRSTFGHRKRDLSLAGIWSGAPSHRRTPHESKTRPCQRIWLVLLHGTPNK